MPFARRLASLLLLCTALAARADDLADILRLQSAGNAAAALPLAERALAAKPRDAQLRFVRGVLLADLGRADEAMAVFRQLVEDYPELAEPYNNLAALHAARGDLDSARAALEQALRARPGYATAHENLGDTYAMLAARAYAEAARLDVDNRSAPAKLQLVRGLLQSAAAAASRP
jgi:Flp pilus assembly protein TadD